MNAMQLLMLALVASTAEAGAWGKRGGRRTARAAVTPADIASCTERAVVFLPEPATPKAAIEKAVDHCALDKSIDDRNYVCPHVKEGLLAAFARLPADRKLSAGDFCELTEAYYIGLRGASRVPNVGHGPLVDFTEGKGCAPAVEAALASEKSLDASKVADFWYAMCLNQDCAHFLPSRTRWCSIDNSQPTHGVEVCDAARLFASDAVTALGAPSAGYGPEELCGIYADFVKELGVDVEAYEHFMHVDARHRVTNPEDPHRALQSSQLKNDAASHKLRDGAKPVRSAAATTGLALAALGLAAALSWLAC